MKYYPPCVDQTGNIGFCQENADCDLLVGGTFQTVSDPVFPQSGRG